MYLLHTWFSWVLVSSVYEIAMDISNEWHTDLWLQCYRRYIWRHFPCNYRENRCEHFAEYLWIFRYSMHYTLLLLRLFHKLKTSSISSSLSSFEYILNVYIPRKKDDIAHAKITSFHSYNCDSSRFYHLQRVNKHVYGFSSNHTDTRTHKYTRMHTNKI